MKGDFSRLTFDALKHYVGVLHQQGRVWLDADWNEDIFDRLSLLEQETFDIIGACGVPDPHTAFAIKNNPKTPANFLISGGPGPRGRYYVDGILARLDKDATYLTQPDYPDPPPIKLPEKEGETLRAVIYLEVWQRLITYLEDATIREIALGGPDTATRVKTIAQVKVQTVTGDVTCANAADFLPKASTGTLTTIQPKEELPIDPCRIPDASTYTGRENRLYRVEIHDGGKVRSDTKTTAGVARFKWSRDNGSFAVQVKAVASDRRTLTLDSLGRDQATVLKAGDIVEVCDDASDLGPARGHLTTLSADPDPDQLTVVLADSLPTAFKVNLLGERHMKLRRWDGVGLASSTYSDTGTPDMNLGDGVHIQFGGGDLQPGDYWLFAARSIDGSVEKLTDAPPMGIIRHRCPLAMVGWSIQSAQAVDLETVLKLFQEIKLSDAQIKLAKDQLDKLKASGIDSLTPSEVDALAQAVKANPDQMKLLDELLQRQEGRARPVMTVLEDCREPFDPLTKRHDCACDCTVTVAPGDSLSAAVDKIGAQGGVICLLPGIHRLDEPLLIEKKHALTIQGAGAATMIQAPNSPVALRFVECDNLTLRDFLVTGGPIDGGAKERAPMESISPGVTVPPGATSAAAITAQLAAVLTFVACRVVTVTGCIVLSANQSSVAQPHMCVAFIGQLPQQPTPAPTPAPANQPRPVTAAMPTFAVNAELLFRRGAETLASGRTAPGPAPEVSAAAAAAITRAAASQVVDFRMSDCALFPISGNHGLLVSGVIGATIENNWIMRLLDSTLNMFGLPGSIAKTDTTPAESIGLALLDAKLVRLVGNRVIQFSIALFGNQSDTEERDDFSDALFVSQNVLAGLDGLAAFLRGINSEITLTENVLVGETRVGQTSAAILSGAVAEIIGKSISLIGNRFQNSSSSPDRPFPYAVGVRGSNISYVGNRSVCSMLPGKTNVLLIAPNNDKRPGTVAAIGNTCVEGPVTNQVRGVLQDRVEKTQDQLINDFLRESDPAKNQVQIRQIMALVGTWAEAIRGLELETRPANLFSLIAVGGVAVTGLNVLNHSLLRAGRGSDQGSVINVQ